MSHPSSGGFQGVVPPGQHSAGGYVCPYCRMPSDGAATSCPRCGAPVDVRLRVSHSGWLEQPPIKDMARLQFNRSTCQISGSYVPVAEVKLHPEDWVYFSHHALLHTDPSVVLRTMKMAGGWNRRLAGMPLYMMTAQGPGFIAFSADHPGETLAVPLQPNQAIDALEHRFLLATGNVGYQWQKSNVWFTTKSGDDTEWHYPVGQFIDRFMAAGAPGLLLLHAHGNVFVRDLQPHEHLLLQPSALIWKDPSVSMSLRFEYPRGQYWFSSARRQAKTIWLALHGPGRIAVQSKFNHPETVGPVHRSSSATRHSW